ncbi:MAG: lysophospholipid acyltransferase family protein [Thermoanaerobaculia bacterium]|nr:lysophospholipid acyltransferase family protein [Thermoanaerobaculia bacterium]
MARKSRLKAFKNWLIWRALVMAFAVGRRIPLATGRRIGVRVGRLAHAVLPRERRKALASLGTAFPEMSDTDRAALCRGVFEHLGQSLFEIFWLPNLNASNFEATTRVEGAENLRKACDQGRGVVLFAGHVGNWEWLSASIALGGFEMNTIARDIYDPRINEFVVRSRAQHGVKSIGRGSAAAAKEILQTLKRGAILAALIDQNIDAENADVEFFGKPAPTPTGPARLAARAGAMAIAAFIERRDGMQVVRYLEPIETTRETDPVELTAIMTRAIEAQIRRVPEQWVWMHERWKRRK